MGAAGTGTLITKSIPEEYCDGTKFIIVNVVLVSPEDGATEYADSQNGWKRVQVKPQTKTMELNFTSSSLFAKWHVYLIVARIGG